MSKEIKNSFPVTGIILRSSFKFKNGGIQLSKFDKIKINEMMQLLRIFVLVVYFNGSSLLLCQAIMVEFELLCVGFGLVHQTFFKYKFSIVCAKAIERLCRETKHGHLSFFYNIFKSGGNFMYTSK